MGEWAIGAAFLLDLILGDPPSWPHPVRWIGWMIDRLVRWAEGWADNPKQRRWAGKVIVIAVVGAAFVLTAFVLEIACKISSALGACLWIWVAYTTLAARSLYDQTWRVVLALKENDLPRARRLLSLVVGRQTEHLSREEVIRAVIETIAENLSDGVIAPLFFLWLGGPSLAMAYKAVNTLDSMIGYKSDRFIDLGRAAAKLDDVVNFIPARLSAFLIGVVAVIVRLDWRSAFQTWWHEGGNHTSPNAGRPEAALAGALGVKLGGPSIYGGKLVEKPTMGQARHPLDIQRVLLAERAMIAAAGLMTLLILLIG